MKKLEDYLKYEQPNKYIVANDEYSDEYDVPVLTAGKSFVLGYTNEIDNIFPKEQLPVIIFDDFTTDCKYVDFPFKVKSSAMKILHPINNANAKFLYYYMTQIKFDNTLHKRYWISEYSQLLIKEMSDVEQNDFVKKMGRIEVLINIRSEQIKNCNMLIKSQFVEMFGTIKNNEKFNYVSIGKLIDKDIIKLKKKFKDGDEIKYIDISSIDNSKNIMTGYTEYKVGNEPSRAQQCLKYNDIVISTVRPNLKNVATNKYIDDNIIGTSGFCVLRCRSCTTEYLKYIVLSDDFTNDMSSITTGANYPAIHSEDIYNYQIPNPPIELQNKFSQIVEQIDKQKFVIGNLCQIIGKMSILC